MMISYLKRTLTCLIILGILLTLGSFHLGFLGKLSITYRWAETPPETWRDLEPAENISNEVTFEKKKCTCPPAQKGLTIYNLKEYWNADDLELATERRKKEYEHHKKREQTENILIASPNSPLGYPIHGVRCLPLSTIHLPESRMGMQPQGGIFCTCTHEDDTHVWRKLFISQCVSRSDKTLDPRLQINTNLPTYKVTLEASLGTIDFLFNISGNTQCQVNGKREKKLSISTSNIRLLNSILRSITYTSTVYSIDSLDIVKFTLGEHTAQIPVSIRQPPIPRLHDPGPERKIKDLVTVTTKTFLRYDKLRTLIKSIRQYYPDIKVIVADDNDQFEKIDDPNVEQYIMPFAKGWFAGRNLAVSQVTTKYHLWVDDDFFFTSDTKIEKMVDVLEATDLDVKYIEEAITASVVYGRAGRTPRNTTVVTAAVSHQRMLHQTTKPICEEGYEAPDSRESAAEYYRGNSDDIMTTVLSADISVHFSKYMVGGNVAGSQYCVTLIFEEGGEDGDCLYWRTGSYHKIPGFPNCVLGSGVVNFFLAHTDRSLAVGFDPKLNRTAHSEFFIDGLGRLRVASCNNVIVGHQKKEKPTDKELEKDFIKYNSFRQNTKAQERFKYGLLYFKNRLSCFTRK